jgi:hypothetical protein
LIPREALVTVPVIATVFPAAVVGILLATIAGIKLACLHARQAGAMGVQPVVDGGEFTQDAIELGIHGRRIRRGTGHDGRCAWEGIRYQIDTAWTSRGSERRAKQ